MEEGQDLYLQGRYADAATAFLAAYDARPFSAFLYNAALAQERGGELRAAIELYVRYLEQEPDASDAEEVRGRLDRLRETTSAQAAQLAEEHGGGEEVDPNDPASEATAGTGSEETPPPQGRQTPPTPTPTSPPEPTKSMISVETDPPNAKVTIRQGQTLVAQGLAPFARTLDVGSYEVSVEHPDYRTVSRTMEIRPGKVYVAILEMSQGAFLGYLRVVSDPPGALVYVDDRDVGAVGETPFQEAVPTGEHHIWVERPGYAAQQRDVDVEIGRDVAETFELQRVAHGRLRIVANVAGATVEIDGEEVGRVPYEADVAAGQRVVVVSADGMKDWEQKVTVERGQQRPLRVHLRPRPSKSAAWVSLILALGAAGGGTALYFLADGIRDDLIAGRDSGRLVSGDSRLTRGRVLAAAAYGGWGIGGVLGLVSLYLFIRDPLPDSDGRVFESRDWSAAPMLGPSSAGGVLRGRF